MTSYNPDSQLDFQELFERQKQELTQSLQYASYIQKALLPADSLLKRYFPEHFLLYMPRDIVSGDFYWVSRKNQYLCLVVADCTGHGVPGAFLSILGITFLNQIVDRSRQLKASLILNALREHVMKALHQTGDLSEQKDGIDLSLCIIDTEAHRMQYAGAFNPLYLIKNGNELVELSADKMPIGVAAEEEVSFRNHELQLDDNDLVYLFTDGYADQFGGPKCKKFKYKPFRELLLHLSSQAMSKQKAELRREHLEWRGDHAQLDDLTIFGFRYKK